MTYEVKLDGLSNVPQANIGALLRAHNGLNYTNGLLEGIAEIPVEYLEQDIRFAVTHKIPVENTASRLENYIPQNDSQELLLRTTDFLARAKGRFMGLFAIGQPGVGKSHVAIGLAKSLELNGQVARYVHVPSTNGLSLPGGDLKSDEVLIIDDLNSAFGWGRQNFSKIIAQMHHHGAGRLFMTSNVSSLKYPEFVANMIGGQGPNDPEIARISDRVGAAIKTIEVQGDSYRQSNAEDPWASFGRQEITD